MKLETNIEVHNDIVYTKYVINTCYSFMAKGACYYKTPPIMLYYLFYTFWGHGYIGYLV